MSTQSRTVLNWKLWTTLAVVVSTVIAFSGGYMAGSSKENKKGQAAVVEISFDASGNVNKLIVQDDYGRAVRLNGIPKRIVSVSPTPTEIVFAIGAGALVVGVDDYSDYPSETQNITKVGTFELSSEKIVSLNPDLIVSSDLVPEEQLKNLEKLGYPYFIFAARTFEDVYKDIRMAGVLTWHVNEAEQLALSLKGRVDAVATRTLSSGVAKPKVYLEYYPLYTFGPGSFGADLIRVAGGENIASNLTTEYPSVTPEFVVAANPDVIVYAKGPLTTTTADEIASRPGWDTISAVKNGKIFSIDENLVSRYGPRIVDCLELLAPMVHPELFP